MYHFNENNIVTGYIKELLHNFELPVCPVYVEGETEIYPNTNYIYNHSIILTNNWDANDNVMTLDGNYKLVQSYVYGQSVLNLTKKLKLNSIIYDTYTHEYLGDYLRFYRDYTGIDLMMLYNCFSNRMAENLDYRLTERTYVDILDSSSFDSTDTKHKIYLVPVKFNKKYLIGIDSDVDVELVCALVDGNVQITQVNTDQLYASSYKSYDYLSFNNPIVFDTHFSDMLDVNLRDMESCLKLCIKLPASNKSSISVVEVSSPPEFFKAGVDGTVADMIFSTDSIGDLRNEYPTKLSLFSINDGVSYPFADRLLEYLFGQAITSDDQVGDNIERVRMQLINPAQRQKNGIQLGVASKVGYEGVWNDYFRPLCYMAAIKPHTAENVSFTKRNYDLTYYIDKDIESLITVAKEV